MENWTVNMRNWMPFINELYLLKIVK
jgi:hypothetical protein